MAKKYMPRWLFEAGTTTIARLHLITGESIENLTRKLWMDYQKMCIDDGVANDWTMAASRGLDWLNQVHATDLPDFLHHLQWYCACFDENGKYKKKKLFDGFFFQKSIQDRDRVNHFLKTLQVYYTGLISGLRNFPPAPDGWSMRYRGMYNDEVRRLTNF